MMPDAAHGSGEPGGREPAPGRLGLVQAFLNSTDLEDEIEAFATTSGVREWIVAHNLAATDLHITEHDRARAIQLREGLRDVLGEHSGDPVPDDSRDRVDDALKGASLAAGFTGAAPVLRSTGSGIDGVFGQLAAIIYSAAIDGTWRRLKTCRNDACRWAFYDSSKNHSGAWCSMAICGSKHKARTYRRRRSGLS